ncbi:unnamed protein product [Meloidogyne enterolobii]|uniref:Uncharacterized protein n=1 Tax=Meloidogyne enterolobii TaxID=390850 RepID=A0ACB0YI80_MELEN
MYLIFIQLLTKFFFLHFSVFLSFFVFNYGQQQFGYSNNNPFYSSLSQSPFSSFSPYGKSSYFYLTPYGNYGQSGYEGPPFGINSYWQPGIAYPSGYGYGQSGGYNPSLQCIDQSTTCALQASSGKCTYSPNTLANCPISCGVPCPASNYLPNYYNNGGGNPLFQQPPIPSSTQPYSPSTTTQYNYNDNFSTNQPFNNQPFFCRDSHIFGCPNWAKLNFCQKIPEFMLNYCRASCGVCNNNYLPSPYKTTTRNPFNPQSTFMPLGNKYFNNEELEGPPEPFGELYSNEFLQKQDNQLPNNFLPYSHYYYLNSPLKAATERKEKQIKMADNADFQQNKILFSEDEQQQQLLQQNNLPTNQKQHQLTPSQMPPSTLTTQHSSTSKLIKMDDLLDN